MSEIGLNINVDSYNNEGIKTIKGNNNAEIYKLYILKNKRRLSLVGKTVKLGYVMAGTTKGDIIENLNITNVEQGEITFPITNRISKQDGVYSCQLAIYGADGFLEHTATFGLTVEANIFTKIAGEIADSKDFTYLENILDKASKLSEKLKENTSSATNANSNLESNITEANNINSKLLENTSTATSLNKNLESNIDLAKEVKETIKDLDTKNTEATEKIETLTGLNSKAEELSNNINKGLPLNSELIKNVESAKTANNELIATNNDAKAKKTDLDNSLEEAKKYIAGLDGSKNPVQMQLDINELKNGLKSNQSLSYEGSSIAANNTLEGRTEGMRIGGRTLVNLVKYRLNNQKVGNPSLSATLCTNEMFKINTTYTIIYTINSIESGTGKTTLNFSGGMSAPDIILNSSNLVGTHKQTFTLSTMPSVTHKNVSLYHIDRSTVKFFSDVLIVEGEIDFIPSYFEGIKSFGEAEGNKISILSRNKNLFDKSKSSEGLLNVKNGEIFNSNESYTSDYIKVEKNKEYILSGNGEIRGYYGVFYSLNKTYVCHKQYKKDTPIIFDSDGYFRFSYASEKEMSSIPATNIQLEEGTQATSYQTYKEDKKDILIKEPLRSKDDKCDILYEDNGQVKIDRYVGIRKYQEGDEKNKDVITDKINTVYILDKPVTEIVENCVDIDLDTFIEKTYFNILNSLPGTLDFKVPSNIASIVQNTAREVNNIWDVINNLLVPGILDVNKKVALATIKNNLK
ncbi:TPA: BppU family phage baseplate upper protein [Clostridium perfringens]|nr:BppU family phage baseplate upper protein [Clostridium perfringens]HAT4097346.1 BppU family phage baseplate upper protein [Clostridium perfringens]